MAKIKLSINASSERIGIIAKTIEMTDKITIGRHSDCDICILEPSMSRQHVVIELVNNEVRVTDLQSSNGTFLNGNQLAANRQMPLPTNTSLQCGKCMMTIQWQLVEEKIVDKPVEEQLEEQEEVLFENIVDKPVINKVEEVEEVKKVEKDVEEVKEVEEVKKVEKDVEEVEEVIKTNTSHLEIDKAIRCLNCMTEVEEIEDICPHCGWEKTTHSEGEFFLPPSTMIHDKRYLVGTVVNFGGFGITYIGWDRMLKQKVAIKEFFPSQQDNPVTRVPGENIIMNPQQIEDLAMFNKGKQRFIEEALVLAKFNKVPAIVSVLEWFEENNTVYMVMEFLEGQGLNEYVVSLLEKRIPYEEAIILITPVIEALEKVHEEGILHRDVSPDNIYMTKERNIRLIDFGAARHSEKDESKTEIVKFGYTPLEQYSHDGNQGSWTDVYALCATLYFMMTGIKPQEAADRAQEDGLKLPSELGIDIPKNIEQAILRGMAINYKLRIQTVNELLLALRGELIFQLPETVLRRRKIKNTVVAVGGAVLVGVGILIYMLFFRQMPIMDGKLNEVLINSMSNQSSQSAVDTMLKKFELEYPQVDFKFTFVKENEYAETLLNAYNSDKLPTLFKSSSLGDTLIFSDKVFSLTELYETLDQEKFFFKTWKENKIIHENVFPLGFDAKVLYYNTSLLGDVKNLGSSITMEKILSYKNLYEEGTALLLLSPSTKDLYLYGCGLNIMDGENLTMSDEQITTAYNGINSNMVRVADNALNDFINQQSIFYLGYASEMQQLQLAMPGYCEVGILTSPSKDNMIIADLTEIWYISDKASNEEKEAAMTFLGYVVGDYCQNILCIQENEFLPVNKDVLAIYMDINDDLKFINEENLWFSDIDLSAINLSDENLMKQINQVNNLRESNDEN